MEISAEAVVLLVWFDIVAVQLVYDIALISIALVAGRTGSFHLQLSQRVQVQTAWCCERQQLGFRPS
jgi:hypothetical protein